MLSRPMAFSIAAHVRDLGGGKEPGEDSLQRDFSE